MFVAFYPWFKDVKTSIHDEELFSILGVASVKKLSKSVRKLIKLLDLDEQ